VWENLSLLTIRTRQLYCQTEQNFYERFIPAAYGLCEVLNGSDGFCPVTDSLRIGLGQGTKKKSLITQIYRFCPVTSKRALFWSAIFMLFRLRIISLNIVLVCFPQVLTKEPCRHR